MTERSSATTIHVNGNLVQVRMTGTLTSDALEKVASAVENAVESAGRPRILISMVDFHGWALGALFRDVQWDSPQFASVERIAVIGDQLWQKGMSSLLNAFTSAEIRYFDARDLVSAREWVGASTSSDADPREAGPSATILHELGRLSSDDGVERSDARQKLIAAGEMVIPFVIPLLSHTGPDLRLQWEAAKILAGIGGPRVSAALVECLSSDFEVRWIAAEALARAGREGARCALKALIARDDASEIRAGVHHVLSQLKDEGLRRIVEPVLDALESGDRAAAPPAFDALRAMDGSPTSC